MVAKSKAKNKSEAAPDMKQETSKVRFNTFVVDGDKYRTLLTEKFKNRKKWEKPDERKIFSDIPGTVIKIYVEEGQKVKEGDLMMVLEAMKMKNKILFTSDGVVKKIHVSEAEKIPKGKLMMELK
ncbi:MAG: acetyl-CoA carboxylase biotin carboxyl carrier protein subunit [Bacteroidales bacterium]|jgi:pyruvate carboxylase|nr:acetyl-CoA carboxylase biotin carboxyl carrier protein subunit [Bacteroidales bacterium]